MELIIQEDSIRSDSGILNFEFDNEHLIINSIDVFQKRCGIGTKLVRKLEEISDEKNVTLIEVPASPTYEAICFWKSMNYIPVSKEDKSNCNKLIKYNNARIETNSGVIVFNKKLNTTK